MTQTKRMGTLGVNAWLLSARLLVWSADRPVGRSVGGLVGWSVGPRLQVAGRRLLSSSLLLMWLWSWLWLWL